MAIVIGTPPCTKDISASGPPPTGPGRRTTRFDRLDLNDDGYLSLAEAQERNPEDYRLSSRRFHELDRNRDGRLSEREWSGSLAEFNRRDRNADGFLSLDEWLRRS